MFLSAQHGDIVIATVDGEFTCKRLQLLPRPMLMPANPAFAPIPLGDDIETVIFGVVRNAIHTL
ncbi:S24 family peptidase [Serratia marcescens]|uniref:S24 family peptidase n=1 Tax=Serratia marcescens TaxID=615 RepID=UPI003FA6C5B9